MPLRAREGSQMPLLSRRCPEDLQGCHVVALTCEELFCCAVQRSAQLDSQDGLADQQDSGVGMGSRANAVVIENGRRHVYYSHWAAQFMDALMFWGPDHALAEVSSWLDGREDDPESDVEWWLDNVWAEGGCCIDLDKRHLVIYGGEDIECDVLWLETYLRLLPYTWRSWTTEWSWGELAQIASYAGLTGDRLKEIDCSYRAQLPKDRERYVSHYLELSDRQHPASSTISVKRGGAVRAAYTCESEPEVMLDLEGGIERVIDKLEASCLEYDDDEFLMGALHLDYDAREIWVWRTWNNNVGIEATRYWSGWKVFDCGYRYRDFYSSVPHFIDFAPRSEDEYLDKIEAWVGRDGRGFSPHGLSAGERLRIFRSVLEQYRLDNPEPRQVPAL